MLKKKKVEESVVIEATPKEFIAPITTDFAREDLNELRDKINLLIARM